MGTKVIEIENEKKGICYKRKFGFIVNSNFIFIKKKVLGDKGTIFLKHTNARFYSEGNGENEYGIIVGVSGATIQWEQGKGIPINIEHPDPSKQALMDFRDSIVDNKIQFQILSSVLKQLSVFKWVLMQCPIIKLGGGHKPEFYTSTILLLFERN